MHLTNHPLEYVHIATIKTTRASGNTIPQIIYHIFWTSTKVFFTEYLIGSKVDNFHDAGLKMWI